MIRPESSPRTPPNAESLVRIGLGCVFVLAAFKTLTDWRPDPDLYGYMAFGRLFWESPSFPYHDVYAYTPTRPAWIYHEWLTGVLFYPIYTHFGGFGLQVVKYALGAATILFAERTAARLGAGLVARTLGLCLAAEALGSGFSPVRAQAFTYAFFTFELWIFVRAAKGRRSWLWALVPLCWVWAQLHGGFVVGVGMIGVFAVAQAVRRRPFGDALAVLAASAVSTAINPYGLDYFAYLGEALAMPRPDIAEWLSFAQAFRLGYTTPVLLWALVPAGVAALGLAAARRALSLWTWAIWGATAYAAGAHIRHIAFFAAASVAFSPPMLEALGGRLGELVRVAKPAKVIAAAGLAWIGFSGAAFATTPGVLAAALTLQAQTRDEAGAGAFFYPVEAVEHIRRAGLSGNLLSTFAWGEYLAFSLGPGVKIAFCGRYETVYTAAFSEEYFAFFRNPRPDAPLLRDFDHHMVLAESGSALDAIFAARSDWRRVFVGGGASLHLNQSRFPKTAKSGEDGGER